MSFLVISFVIILSFASHLPHLHLHLHFMASRSFLAMLVMVPGMALLTTDVGSHPFTTV